MKKIPTAEGLLTHVGVTTSPVSGLKSYLKADVIQVMIKFAELHVEAALKAAVIKVQYKYFGSEISTIESESILNAYPLDNIK